MTTHAIQIVSATTQADSPATEPSPGPPDWVASLLQDRLNQNVIGTHTEVLSAQGSDFSESNPPERTAHYRASKRFDNASDKATLLDDIENKVVTDADWYEIRYHECTHDEANPSPCPDWTAERSGGTVPSDV